jgi:hypothetical protein
MRGRSLPDGLEYALELNETPFFPQERYQCGPASLAMVLAASGVQVRPEELTDSLFLPKRRGSLQTEIVAVSRRHGRIPFKIPGTLSALIRELKNGRPVIVLQNLGIKLIPVYHYAVVIGADPPGNIVLRSGTKPRLVMAVDDFWETWNRSGRWGLVMLRPGEIPDSAEPISFLREVSSFESAGYENEAGISYQAALNRWPDNELVLLSMGNNFLRRADYRNAAMMYQRVLAINSDNIVAANNLADVLSRQQCHWRALEVINEAIEQASIQNSPYLSIVYRTREEIVQSRSSDEPSSSESCPAILTK